MNTKTIEKLRDGEQCAITGETHKGKFGP